MAQAKQDEISGEVHKAGAQRAFDIASSSDEAKRSRLVILRILRMGFISLLMTVTLLFILRGDSNPGEAGTLSVKIWWYIPLTLALVLAFVAILLDEYGPRKIGTLSALFFGLLAGLIATYALSFVVDLLAQTYDLNTKVNAEAQQMLFAVKVILGMCFCYLGVATVLRTQDDFRLVIPYVEFAKQVRGPKPMILDSSVLIDGRIVELSQTGFVVVPLVIPRFVLAELQSLADSSNRSVRTRGRRGLDVVSRLQRLRSVDVLINDTHVESTLVDQQLVELAKALQATILTTDSALNSVAEIHGVSVLDLTTLAASVRPAVVPGARFDVSLVKIGEQPHQGVGYLDDGTMVVVDQASSMVGQSVQVEVASTLQTSAGRLVFARLSTAMAEGDKAGSSERSASEPGTTEGAAAGNDADPAASSMSLIESNAAGQIDDSASSTDSSSSGESSLSPTTVKPPGPPKPSPFPPVRGQRSPNRNPRRY